MVFIDTVLHNFNSSSSSSSAKWTVLRLRIKKKEIVIERIIKQDEGSSCWLRNRLFVGRTQTARRRYSEKERERERFVEQSDKYLTVPHHLDDFNIYDYARVLKFVSFLLFVCQISMYTCLANSDGFAGEMK